MQSPPSSADSYRKSHIKAACVVLFIGTMLLFSRALVCGFVNYDDPTYVTDNAHVRAGLTWDGIVWAFTGAADYWHPLAWISHMLDCQLFGSDASGHHLTSVFWHSANAVLAFLLFVKLTGCFWRSLFAAALFAWHPLRVESVVWVTERKDVMSGFFFLLTLLAYTGYAARRSGGKRSVRSYLAVLGLFALGLMSKPMLVTLPLVLLLLDWWPLGRAGSWKDLRSLLVEKVPFFVLSGAASIATLLMQIKARGFVLELGLMDRLGNAVVSIARYLGSFVWPFDLIACHVHPGSWPVVGVIAASALLAGLCVFAWMQRKLRPWITVGIAWFLVVLLPVLGLIQAGFQAMADRYTYLSMLGIVLAAVWSIPSWSSQILRKGFACFLGLLLAGCAIRTWDQEGVWRNSIALFSHAVQVDEGNDVAHNFLASAYFAVQEFPLAATHANRALELNPRNDRALVMLGGLAEHEGRIDDAAARYREALALRPGEPQVESQLGLLEFNRGRVHEARELLTRALREDDGLLERTLQLGEAAFQRGDNGPAEFFCGVVLAVEPDDPRAHAGIGLVLMGRGDATGAISHLRAAVTGMPERADLQLALARCAQKLGLAEESGAALERAVRMSSKDPATLADAADLYARRREFPTAIRLFHESLAIDPENARAHAALGYLLIFTGDRAGGITEWKRALELDPNIPGLQEQLKKSGQ